MSLLARTELFQSHCGSIGTALGLVLRETLISFQSHCGSIGTPCRLHRGRARAGFNPTVVRLALIYLAIHDPARMVSIPLWFDWHPPAAPAATGRVGFNPTVVRLARADGQVWAV